MSTTQLSKLIHVRRGDLVLGRSGDDRGKRGRVLAISSNTGRVTVEGVNLVTRHVRPGTKRTPVGRVQQPAPLATANVQLICPQCIRPTKRVAIGHGDQRIFTCKRCHEPIKLVKDQA